MLSDLCFAFRSFAKAPGFTAVVSHFLKHGDHHEGKDRAPGDADQRELQTQRDALLLTGIFAQSAGALSAPERAPVAVAVAAPSPLSTSAGKSFAKTSKRVRPLASRGVATADFNDDGFLHASVVDANTPDVRAHRVYLGEGTGDFADSGEQLADATNWAGAPALGDIESNGTTDAVTEKTVWLNDRHGHFASHRELIETSDAGFSDLVKLASWLPARRATRLNPIDALRAEQGEERETGKKDENASLPRLHLRFPISSIL